MAMHAPSWYLSFVVRTTHTLSVLPNLPVNLFVSFSPLCCLVTLLLTFANFILSNLFALEGSMPESLGLFSSLSMQTLMTSSILRFLNDTKMMIYSSKLCLPTILLYWTRFIYPLGHGKDKTELLLFPQNMFCPSSSSQFVLTPLLYLPGPNSSIIFDFSCTHPLYWLKENLEHIFKI